MRLNIIHISSLIQFDVPELKYFTVYSVDDLRRQERYEELHYIVSQFLILGFYNMTTYILRNFNLYLM
jgi:hypothetical protein